MAETRTTIETYEPAEKYLAARMIAGRPVWLGITAQDHAWHSGNRTYEPRAYRVRAWIGRPSDEPFAPLAPGDDAILAWERVYAVGGTTGQYDPTSWAVDAGAGAMAQIIRMAIPT